MKSRYPYIIIYILLLIFVKSDVSFSQIKKVPSDRLLTDSELISLLDENISEVKQIKETESNGNTEKALQQLALYFKGKFSERYFFNWKNFKERFSEYTKKYPGEKQNNFKTANEHILKFPAKTKWQLPFKDLFGNDVTAYELRHLSRQHKAINIAMVYYYTKEDTSYLNYFINQVKSLDNAFELGEYDKEDNGVYEYFRAGYRVFNWLFVHNAYLASDNYDLRDQILLIKTLLHTGAQLQNKTKRFRFGNHHTKGLCSLFQLSVLFPEFYGIDIWMKQSVEQLTMHLQKEINDDGFQFERSVHYHIGDIENYFYVFQLAKINDIKLPVDFTDKLRSMFDALVKIAQPNKRLPVLQDDTDEPWAEFNQLDNIMTIGAILFQDKIYRYFASDNIPSNYYWLIRPSDAKIIYEEKGEQPAIGSTALNSTGYYVMRNGWKLSNQYMIISAGLSKEKPDHQHGDMLGVAAYSNGNEILPNYQVRYFLNDFEFFKNSWVKNVALVDSLPQGRNWQPNSGGSGFGKWRVLPKPKTLAWYSNDGFDYFAGTHNGYDSSGVKYNREILFIKDGFWIVKDNFESGSPHSYQQIWQGHYGIENNHHLRSTFSNSSGLEIIQLKDDDYKINSDGWHGKQNFVFNVSKKNNYSFTTLLYPFKYFGYIINDETQNDSLSFFNWTILKHIDQKFSDAKFIVSNNGNLKIFIDAKFITLNNHKLMFDKSSTFYVKQKNENFEITLLGKDSVDTVNEYNLKFIPGKKIVLNMKR